MFFSSGNQFLSALHPSFYTDFESSSMNHCILKKRKGLLVSGERFSKMVMGVGGNG